MSRRGGSPHHGRACAGAHQSPWLGAKGATKALSPPCGGPAVRSPRGRGGAGGHGCCELRCRMRVSGRRGMRMRELEGLIPAGCPQLAHACLLTVASRHVPGRPGECKFGTVLKCHKSRTDLEDA